jgi:Ion channel
MRKVLPFGIFPLMINVAIAAVAFFFKPSAFDDWPLLCYLTAAGATVFAAVPLVAFCINDVEPRLALFILIAQAVALILIFAGIYRGYGLVHAQTNSPLDWMTGLYFSIVTWTTLGYGDLLPKDQIRLLAAWQALLGYIFLGFIVGIGTSVISGQGSSQAESARTASRQSAQS